LNKLFDILKRFLMESMGGIATSSMMVCAVSGIFLAVPYDIREPLDSISLMLLDNPAAAYIRNLHFWSAQFFLVFTILHLIDHFIQNTEYQVSRGIWLRLTLSLPVLFYVMISGFILKGDADAFSAFRILSSLFERIPLAGDLLKSSLLGNENSLELVYVHHIATATIILFIILYEHSRKVWPAPTGFIMLLFIFLILSFFVHAPFGQDSGKGPWYFTGLQEILYWSSRPGWTWILLLAILALILVLPRTGFSMNLKLKNLLLILLIIYGLLTITGSFFRGENWQWKWPWTEGPFIGNVISFHPLTLQLAEELDFQETIPVINGQREGCMVCHNNVTGFEEAHNPAAIGCFSCHQGNPFTLDKKQAHKEMIMIPGNLADAAKSCGTAACHPDIPRRVSSSIMSTMSGVVTVDRYVFGEIDDLNSLAHIRDIEHTAADQHLRDLCANCHLGHPKTDFGPVTQLSRGGGCNACHLNYSDSALVSLLQVKAWGKSGPFYHPQLSLNITDGHCFGCHSRSGRIALNYEGWHETLLEKNKIPSEGKYRILEDQRVIEFVRDDIHHQKGMTCIDCHISTELMGDVKLYAHKEEQVKIKCEDCHFEGNPGTIAYRDLDSESKKIIAQRKWQAEDLSFIKGSLSNLPMINVWFDKENMPVLRLKSGDTILPLRPPAKDCTQGKAHKSLSCGSCHTAWTPQCIGCHNTFDKKAPGYDMLEDRLKEGSWVEHVGLFMTDKPVLGIIEQNDGNKVVMTFTPGMILSVDTSSFNSGRPGTKNVFRRLYAPAAAHSTVKESRGCKSCHLDPLAIGYGRGELVYEINGDQGKWVLRSRFSLNAYDRLPEDAWIGFLTEPEGILATRTKARPFNLKEQQSILTVGACLVCHPENSKVIEKSLDDFPALIEKVSDKCALPAWN